MLNRDQVAAIEADYRAGYGPVQASRRNSLSWQTVTKYYGQFAAQRIPRGGCRPTEYPGRGWGWPAPYTGPAIIGHALDTKPTPSGPDWIGKRVWI